MIPLPTPYYMNKENYEFEVCANSVESCIAAERAGANRVELCMGIPEGGTTPSYGEIKMAREVLKRTHLHVIIRNRGGDFLYSPEELQRMTYDIDMCRELGVDGVVFGCLTADGRIDHNANKTLMAHTGTMNVTFHRAFDRCSHPEQAIDEIFELGFNRILTSGQQPTAAQGIPLLRRLKELSAGKIDIMAGCGVNEENIAKIQKETKITSFHFSAREPQPSKMKFFNNNVYMGNNDVCEDIIMVSSERRIRETMKALIIYT